MSGGSLDYVYQKVEEAARHGMVNDTEEQVVREIAQLLHDIEWSASGDYTRNQWRKTLSEFCSSWSGGYEDSIQRKLSPKFDLEEGDKIVDMGGNTWYLNHRLYDPDTDKRFYQFVRVEGMGQRTMLLEQKEVHAFCHIEFNEDEDDVSTASNNGS